MGDLDAALSLRAASPTRWEGIADSDHESNHGMFGGWTAAICLASVLRSAGGDARASALNVSYLSSIEPGSAVTLDVEHLGGSRSLDHWRSDLRSAESGALLAASTAVITRRRPTDAHCQWTVPNAPEPDTVEVFQPPGTQGFRTKLRIISGDFESGDSRTLAWLRMEPRRAVDQLQLAYLCDQYAPRCFFYGAGGPRPSATVTLSVYFHATEEDLAASGSDYVLSESTGTRGEQATSGQQVRLWSRQGALLATSEQLCWYR